MQRITKKTLSIVHLILCAFIHCITYGHGFSSNTPVELVNGSRQTIHTICLYALHNTISVASYDTNTFCNTNQLVKIGRRSTSNCYIRLNFDLDHNRCDDIMCTPMQEFYVLATGRWTPAYNLKYGDALLTKDNIAKPICFIQFIPEPLKIYTLEIEKTHTFFVGKYSVLTHNMILPIAASLGFTIPFGSVATGAAGSFFGPVGMIGGIVLGGVMSIAIKAIYENRILRYKTPTYDIESMQDHCRNVMNYHEEINLTIKPTGCFDPVHAVNIPNSHILPIENPLPQATIGCIEIEIYPVQKNSTRCYDRRNEQETTNNGGCFQNIEQNEQYLCVTQEKIPTAENQDGRYNGPKARNWKEFERECPVGQQYGKKFINIGKQNPKDGSPLRQLSEDIPNAEMFKKNNIFALDKFHEGDHLEVWNKRGNWIGVANLDGSKNHKKSNSEEDPEGRNIRDII